MTDEQLYEIYEELDGEDLFPPGLDEFSFAGAPVFILYNGNRFEAGSVKDLLGRIIGAYRAVYERARKTT